MNQKEIKQFIQEMGKTKEHNIAVVDFANVDKWQKSLGWPVGIKLLAQLIKNFCFGTKGLRRFYYCMDYGPKEKSKQLTKWSEMVTTSAEYNNFELVTKRVKYIPDIQHQTGYIKKGNLDIEMAMDLITMVDEYDAIVLFSGDGDLECVLRYLKEKHDKKIYVFGARDHIGRELIDAQKAGIIERILFVEDFEYRLNLNRGR